MHERDVLRIVESRSRRNEPRLAEDRLDVLVALLGEQHLVRLLVDPVVAGTLLLGLLRELGRDLVQAVVHLDVVVRLAGDDERRARLVDQDGVHFVDDRVVEASLHALVDGEHHVVAQVVEAELVVGAVRDVGAVRGLLFGVTLHGQVDADRQAEEFVDAPHPVRVALGEVLVDGDDVHALARERVEIGGKRRHQRLAFAGAHFRDLAVVQRHAADELDVEVAHRERSLAGLAHDRERIGQHVVERLAAGNPRLELVGLAAQLVVGQLGDGGLERVDGAHDLGVLLEQALVAAAEDAGQDVGDHSEGPVGAGWTSSTLRSAAAPKKQGVRTASPRDSRAALSARCQFKLACWRNLAGFCGTPFSRTSKCRCGPVDRPVEPTVAIF